MCFVFTSTAVQSAILGSACSTAFRLRSLSAWNTFGVIMGHRSILSRFNSLLPEIEMVSDRLLPEYMFGNLFKVVLPSRNAWLSNEVTTQLNDSIVFFTDGSRLETKTGFGVFSPSYDLRYSGSLGRYSTVLQAELTALTWCVIEALSRNTTNKNVVFCTDSKSVLNTLKNPLIVSKLVKDCIKFLNRLCSENSVTVMWVPPPHTVT